MSVVDKIQHYQRSLERCTDNEPRTLHCIEKLFKLPVTVQHLKVTGVGKTVNALRKFDGSVGDAAKALVAKWKLMVVDDETSEEEDEACVPDVPEGYSDRSNSPKYDRDNGDDRNSSNYKSNESREKQSRSSDKHDSSRHGTKNSSSSSENSKPRENELKSSRESTSDKYKSSKNGIDKRHTKSETKNEVRSEKKSKSSGDSKSEKGSDSSKEVSKSAKNRIKNEDTRKESSRVSSSSSSSNGGTNKNSNNHHDSHRKRKIESSSGDRESSKRRKSVESPVDDDPEDPDEVATQILSRDSDEETRKILPDTSIESDSEEEISKTKVKYESPASPPQYERGSSHSKHSGKTEKSSKSKSRESSGKSTTSGTEKSRRESDKNEKSKSEKIVDHRKNEKRKDRSPSKESSSKSRNHSSSSSSSKDQVTSKDKDECSESSKGKRDRSECDSKDTKEQFKEPKDKKVKKKKIKKDDGIDCNSGASFAEALGMCTDRPVVRKKANPASPSSPVKTIKTEPGTSSSSSSSSSGSKSNAKVKSEPQASSDPEPLSLLAPNVKLEPLNVDLASTLPEISPNYKPLPAHYMNPVHRKQEESRVLSDVIYARSQRTKVYSGMKSGYTSVPTLCEEAIRVLIENIHELGFTGGIPYDIIKPVLERATPDQLFTVENYNPYLIEDTDQLWQFHCGREFRTKKREEMETWREMYLRCREEREAKFKTLTANIKESIDKSVPVRSAKLAYVDKPPRNVLRQQAKYGTAKVSTSSSDLKKQMILSGSSNSATNISVPPPPMSRMKSSSSSVMKKNKAPLMAKALQLIKGRYKR